MADALNISDGNARQYIIAVYFLGYGAGQLLLGPFADRFGRKKPLVFGLVVYALGSLLAAFTNDFALLLFLRAIQGIGAAATRVSGQSAIRDRYESREMAAVMSFVFMIFMAMPVVAPALGQLILAYANWHMIFIAIAFGGAVTLVWTLFRFDETLAPEHVRPLNLRSVAEGIQIVVSNRTALFYALASTFILSALIAFINTAQQLYLEIYQLGDNFPLAFAGVALLMLFSAFLNGKFVSRYGQRRLSHGSLVAFAGLSGIWFLLATQGIVPFWLFFPLFASIMFTFGWCGSNMTSLSLEQLGEVAGTASSIFGAIQTVLSAVLGLILSQMFDGTDLPLAGGFLLFGILAIICVLIAEKGQLFGVGETHRPG
jgi:DHA1 family bicyclomycin/chloramphenicol resistance-like MFS transporter